MSLWWYGGAAAAQIQSLQILVPNLDLADGTWLNELGTNTNLYASIDEGVVPNDADYVESATAPFNDTMDVALSDGLTPDVGTVYLVIRHRTS